ncbi:MAG: hypothetical protein NTW56_16345 [Alphaproteobacteria bacterium]|nr:hypothetical protein [Alphaproteobacteria bacterium]
MTPITAKPPVFPAPLPEPQPGRVAPDELAARDNLLRPMGAPQASMAQHARGTLIDLRA